MARITRAQKAERVLRFLLGIGEAEAVASLRAHGFDARDLDEGWSLLRDLAVVRLDGPIEAREKDPFAPVAAWAGRWLPLARAAVERRFPELGPRLFSDGPTSRAIDATLAVARFIEALDALGDAAAEVGELLARRGITPAVLAEARQAVAHAKALPPVHDRRDPERDAAAERRLWDWYLEWSQIARRGIGSRRLLRELGLVSGAPAADAADDGPG